MGSYGQLRSQPYLAERASVKPQEFRTVWVGLGQGDDGVAKWMRLRAQPSPPPTAVRAIQYLDVFM